MLLIVTAVVPALVRVTDLAALVVVTVWLPKASEVGDKLTAVMPVPVSDVVWGLVPALSLTDSVALRNPTAVGLKVTLMVQFAPAATLEPHVLLWAKSPELVPVKVMLLMVRAALPVLDSVTGPDALVVVTVWLPNANEAGVRPAIGPVPLPLSPTVCGLPGALSTTERVALRVPIAVGLKVMLMVQPAPAPSVAPQLLVREKSPEFVPVTETLLIFSVEVPVFFSVTV